MAKGRALDVRESAPREDVDVATKSRAAEIEDSDLK
jgi:hypothetical protein